MQQRLQWTHFLSLCDGSVPGTCVRKATRLLTCLSKLREEESGRGRIATNQSDRTSGGNPFSNSV